MRIGVDIRFLAKGTRTGIEEYAINLLSRLLPLDKSVKYQLFYNAFNKIELDYAWLDLPNVQLKKFRLPNRFVFDPLAKVFKQPKIDRLLGGVDVFFEPHFLLSPVSASCKKVITFHDLSFVYFPDFFPLRKRLWHQSLSPKNRAKEADRIVAVSESTRQDLIRIYGLPAQKITAISLGVGEEFLRLSADTSVRAKNKYNLPDQFILYFGTLEPRKNLIGLIKSYEIFRSRNNAHFLKLVIAGRPGWLYKEIIGAAKDSPYSEDIFLTGFIDPVDKVYLYNLASFFVYPSFFEGFGFPPLEAMACGVPVICSHTSSLPEVVGNAALMIDPYNFDEIAWAMGQLWNNQVLRQELISRGLARAKRFSWDVCAKKTLEILKN